MDCNMSVALQEPEIQSVSINSCPLADNTQS